MAPRTRTDAGVYASVYASVYVGIDVGTSGCRAVAIDADAVPVAEAGVALPAPQRDGDGVSQSAAVWWQAVDTCLHALCARLDGRPVAALAVDGTSGTLLAVDADGRPLAPALMYHDARATAEARRIARHAPPECGAHGASSGLAKLLYLQRQLADAPVARFLHQADWIAGRLCGRFDLSDENNALKLGYDVRRREWPPWLAALGVAGDILPEVVAPGTVIGDAGAAGPAWPGIGGWTRVVAGTTDGVAAFLATGVDTIGEAVTSLGTTLVLKILTDRPVFAPDDGVYSHRLGDRWLAGGASNCGGGTLLQFFTPEVMERLSLDIDPEQATGLDYYPLPAVGERFPVNDPALRPRLTPRPADDRRFFQGLLEGLAEVEARGYHRLQALGAPYPSRVLSVGGGAHNTAWRRIRARRLGVPVLEAARDQAAYGTALLAARALVPGAGRPR